MPTICPSLINEKKSFNIKLMRIFLTNYSSYRLKGLSGQGLSVRHVLTNGYDRLGGIAQAIDIKWSSRLLEPVQGARNAGHARLPRRFRLNATSAASPNARPAPAAGNGTAAEPPGGWNVITVRLSTEPPRQPLKNMLPQA